MPSTASYTFDTAVYKGAVTFHTGLYINGQWVDPIDEATIDVINPTNGKVITSVSVGSSKDVDVAVDAAEKAYKTSWGLKVPGPARAKLLFKLADLVEAHADELTALEALDTGKVFAKAKAVDIQGGINTLRYYAGWADKIHGQTMEVDENRLAYTRREPYGVVGQIIPWNFPFVMAAWKIAPALATGNTVILKPSEITPLSALKLAELITEAGFPPGVVNVINGYGPTVGEAISTHPRIRKVAFTGSAATGRRILKASAESNLKSVTLELGGKSPTIVFDDANLDQAVKWAAYGIFFNMGQVCTAGSRIYVHEAVYDEFLQKLSGAAAYMTQATGDNFSLGTEHGPQVSRVQFDRVMGYIESGKSDGANVHIGGAQHGTEGFFIQPTIFTDVKPSMKIVREEIFGPVASVIKFKDEAEVIEAANDTEYGLTCNLFSENASRALRVAHALEAGSAFVNCAQALDVKVPFGGFKQSGIGRELGEYALDAYTQIKAVHVNIGLKL